MPGPLTFRNTFTSSIPSWLYNGDGGKVTYVVALLMDVTVERLLRGLNARFPTRADPTANALTGDDRGILKGRIETDEHYAQRLIGWRWPRGHRVRGSAFALLEQTAQYLGGEFDSWTIDQNQNRHDRSAAGEYSYEYKYTWTWEPQVAGEWARFWVVCEAETFAAAQALEDPNFWGGSFGTEGYSLGQSGFLFEDVRALRGLLTGRPWKPSGTRGEWLILKLRPVSFAPTTAWVHWSVLEYDTKVPVRDSRLRYVSYAPTKNNAYPGYTPYPRAAVMPSEEVYEGDASLALAEIPLYDGTTYGGNPDSFPATIQLVDDGDPTP